MTTPEPTTGERLSGPRSVRGERTRARLIEAARGVFEDQGYLDARISDIAERAGLSHGSFYHYFDSKEQVFLEVVEAHEENLSSHAVVHSWLLDPDSDATLRDRLTESNRRYFSDYRDGARIMGVIEQVSRYNDVVRDARFARQRLYTQQTEHAIRRLQEMGLADPDIDPAIAAPALAAMVTRFAEMWLVQGLFECAFDDGVEQLTAVCVNALRLEDPRS